MVTRKYISIYVMMSESWTCPERRLTQRSSPLRHYSVFFPLQDWLGLFAPPTGREGDRPSTIRKRSYSVWYIGGYISYLRQQKMPQNHLYNWKRVGKNKLLHPPHWTLQLRLSQDDRWRNFVADKTCYGFKVSEGCFVWKSFIKPGLPWDRIL